MLEHFPVIQSRLERVSDRELQFRVSEDGLSFSVDESGAPFDINDPIGKYIEPVRSIENQPLTKISVTQTPDGTVLTVSVSHALVDGFSYFHLLSAWARLHRGDRFLTPHIPRDIFSSHTEPIQGEITKAKLYENCGLFLSERRTDRPDIPPPVTREYISHDVIRSYISDTKQKHGIPVSENDVITALLWKKHVAVWPGSDDDDRVYITCPYDFRRILSGFPKNYFGCGICFATAETTRDHLTRAPAGELAVLIKKAISGIREDYIKRSISTLEGFRVQNGPAGMEHVHLRHPHNGMIVTNLTRLPVRDLDFGSGAPDSFLSYAEITRGAAVLPARDGVELYVAHPVK